MNEIYKQLELLNEVVKRSLSLEEVSTSKNLIFFIRRSLYQMGLYPEWHESEILVEAYMRIRQQIMAGKEIQNLPAYLARVSQFIVLEKRRQRKRNYGIRQKLTHPDEAATDLPDDSYTEGIDQEVVHSLWKSFDSLPERDRQILTLRIVKGYSWKEVACCFVESKIEPRFSDSLIPKLRTQGKRALEKLRKGMLSVNS
ncbi:sigma-70 family RNA polymerase sigma factor [Oscillatoria sp. CS-180]|uniref:RNA polymerase sigma factor n=1 Tax=Oscillatoria sp. CS-180 TaxID=3021720 RepID=UPI00232F0DBD|nr:sigma-70 family RNA polymerase sigma factor [Oscillatoria sp. CS-180]MDB9528157.1 sigma-70 family RNA polymerase sigma factor [Oscillatoria sp. CS-180]